MTPDGVSLISIQILALAKNSRLRFGGPHINKSYKSLRKSQNSLLQLNRDTSSTFFSSRTSRSRLQSAEPRLDAQLIWRDAAIKLFYHLPSPATAAELEFCKMLRYCISESRWRCILIWGNRRNKRIGKETLTDNLREINAVRYFYPTRIGQKIADGG